MLLRKPKWGEAEEAIPEEEEEDVDVDVEEVADERLILDMN